MKNKIITRLISSRKWEAEEFWDQLPDFGQKHTKKFLDKIEYRKEQYYENRRLRNIREVNGKRNDKSI